MLQELPRRLGVFIMDIGAASEDSEEIRLRKRILVIGSFMLIFAGALWGAIYIVNRENLAGLIPLAYSFLSLLIFIIFGFSRDYTFYRDSQLLLILMVPFLLMIMLGGFVNSSAVILWSVICPLGALLLVEPRQSIRWLVVYLVLLLFSGLLQPSVRIVNNLPESLVIIFFIMNIAAVSTIVFILLAYFVRGKEEAVELLRQEQDKSERLLLNVLPEEVASVLKDENRTVAEQFDSMSVLFADVVGFTPLTAELAPREMVDLLNEVFSYFDALVEKYDLEKIRSIGDNYMVASGVPRPRPDHASALAHMALEAIEYLNSGTMFKGRRLQFRIGMNSGQAVGGVIGKNKFHYDLWGEAVNTASRMESHGVPGKIQITKDTYELLKDEFICTLRGNITAKGIGEMETWFLEGVRSA